MKPILDACCGSRMFWFDKANPAVVFMDNRNFEETLCDGRRLEVRPDVVADFRDMPFPDKWFRLVVFDPPHLIHAGDKSWIGTKYGPLLASVQIAGHEVALNAVEKMDGYFKGTGISSEEEHNERG